MQSFREMGKRIFLKSNLKPMEASEKDPLLCSKSETPSTISSSDSSQRQIRPLSSGPDGVRAWFIAFIIFFINFVIVGESRVAGILYVHFVSGFHVDRKIASAPYSIQQSTRNLFGPVVGILGQKYGVRFVAIVGGVIVSVSCGSCYFADDIVWIIVMWGAVYGIGTAFSCTVNQVMLDDYFIKYRSSASGLAFSGGCAGAFFFPALLEMLTVEYGIEGSFLILGAICLFVIPAAMLLKKPPWIKKGNFYVNISEANSAQNAEESLTFSSSNIGSDAEGSLKTSESEALATSVEKMVKVNDFPSHVVNKNCSYSEERVNYQFLRQNNELVLKLLTMKIPSEDNEIFPCSCKRSQNYFLCPEVAYVTHELEQMYYNLEQPTESSQCYITKVKESIRLLDQHERKIYALDEDCGNINFRKKCVKFEGINSMTISEIQSDANISECVVELPRNLYIPLKLRELCDKGFVNLLWCFHDQTLVSNVLKEMKKVHEIFNVNENSNIKELCSVHSSSKSQETCFNFPREETSEISSNTLWKHIKTAIVLHKNPLFLLVCLCRCVYMLTFTPVLTSVVDFAMDKGMKPTDGKYVIAALSFGDLFGRLCFGWITDKGFLSLMKFMFVMMVILGANTVVLPFIKSRELLILALVLFSTFQGALFIRHPVIVSRYLKSHEQFIGLGFINFSSGILAFALPAFIGYFRDYQGSYDNMFYINGAISTATGLLWAFESHLVKSSAEERTEYV